MQCKFKNVYSFILIFFATLSFIACSSSNERLIIGKWSLSDKMVGDTPASFWFKKNGTVVAPWENSRIVKHSSGIYKFIDFE